jgi:mono/diheme cytochrome c family protein
MKRTLRVLGTALVLSFGVANAEEAGNPLRGSAYARQMCAGCHAIAADTAASPNSLAPPFRRVAQKDSLNAESFADWLGTAHPPINGVAIKPAVAGDILAYIRSLGVVKENANNNQ